MKDITKNILSLFARHPVIFFILTQGVHCTPHCLTLRDLH